MQIISPINAETCRSYIGRQVCAVLHDGTEYVGTIREVRDNGLLFEPIGPEAAVLSHKPAKGKPRKKGAAPKKNAETSAFYPGPYGYGYPAGGLLAWSAISLLFLIPFLFI